MDPMRLYVLWAPSAEGADDLGRRLARALRDQLNALGMVRDSVGFRIPVHHRSSPWRPGMLPRPIDFAASRSNVFVVLDDDVMGGRPSWAGYIAPIAERWTTAMAPISCFQSRCRMGRVWPRLPRANCRALWHLNRRQLRYRVGFAASSWILWASSGSISVLEIETIAEESGI